MKKQTLLAMFGAVTIMLGCTLRAGTPAPQTQVDEVGTVVAATMLAYTASPTGSVSTPALTQMGGTPVSFETVSFVIQDGLAGGANEDRMTAVETNSNAPWEIAPTHWRVTLSDYAQGGKFHEPRLYLYPAAEYAQVNSFAAEQMENTRRILAGSTILQETLPRVPWFNAELLIAAHIQVISFQNGSGVRALTQYAQYAAPINNRELFYHFEGLTSDGAYYLVAILPITASILADDEKPEASVPQGGVPIPADIGITDTYYISVTEKLNSLAPDAYHPSINQLDALIQSILVTTP
jgi:hypothetical protein